MLRFLPVAAMPAFHISMLACAARCSILAHASFLMTPYVVRCVFHAFRCLRGTFYISLIDIRLLALPSLEAGQLSFRPCPVAHNRSR
jgi:hypothetical protein